MMIEESASATDLLSSPADEIVDELLPGDFEWRDLVCSYPLSALAVAAAAGFLIGRRRGPELIASVSAFLTNEVTRNVHSLLGDERADDADYADD